MSIDYIVTLAAKRIGELLVQEAKFLYGVEDQVRSLQRELRMMNAYLKDMEAMDEEGGDERAHNTIQEIRRIAYDAEDVIETYIFEAKPSSNKAVDFLKRYAGFFSCLLRTHQVGSEIEAIKVRISQTIDIWEKYQGGNGSMRPEVESRLNRAARRRHVAYPHIHEDHVIGLELDINKLVGVLTTSGTKIQVLSLVGMGGSGKTTLARKLYNHEGVKKHFHCIAWVSVSEEWALERILQELLRKASGESLGKDEAWNLEVLAEKLNQYLEKKRYLVVLDDVWTKEALGQIFRALPPINGASKVIVTTRNQEVTDFPSIKCYMHSSRSLTEEESWELFRKIALLHREETNSFTDIVGLKALGKEMLKKCNGLPLAVVALAGILVEKQTLEEWEKVQKAVSSRIMERGRGTTSYGQVNEMLALSYYNLPRELKPCFLYLTMFAEDSDIHALELTERWIAEGFVTSDMLHEGETLEDVAQDYLEELVHRCVVQIAWKDCEGKTSFIRVHDLMRDLCIKIAGQQDFSEIFTNRSPNLDARVAESRRATIYSFDKLNLPAFPTKSRHLRCLVYGIAGPIGDNHQHLNLRHIHQNFRVLRVLVLYRIETGDGSLPAGIGSLIHLRYLRLWRTNITKLPSSVGNLLNLITLDCIDMVGAIAEVRIPDVLWKIEGLRHLALPGKYSTIKECRFKLHTLKDLQTLWGIGGGSWMLEELPKLSENVRKLGITGIASEKQLEAAFQCPSIRSDRLRSLFLEWDATSQEGEVLMLKSIEPIIHCQHLRSVELNGRLEDRLGCGNIQFPTSVKELRLRGTELEAEATLAALGKLPNLISLTLSPNAYKGTKWTCTGREFLELKELSVHELTNLEEWRIERGAMPLLSKLVVTHCVKLRRIPEGLKFITSLQELHMDGMNDEFRKRTIDGGEDAHTIQHVPLIRRSYKV